MNHYKINYKLKATCTLHVVPMLFGLPMIESQQFSIILLCFTKATLEEYSELRAGKEESCTDNLGVLKMAHVPPSLHELHWLPICFRILFQVWVRTFQAFYGMGPGYLRNYLTPMCLACTTHSSKGACCRPHQSRNFS